MQRGVGAERAAPVALRTEQDRLPERGDLRHVRLDVEMRDVREDPADDRVGQRLRVERADQPLDVLTRLDVHAVWGYQVVVNDQLRLNSPSGPLSVTVAVYVVFASSGSTGSNQPLPTPAAPSTSASSITFVSTTLSSGPSSQPSTS